MNIRSNTERDKYVRDTELSRTISLRGTLSESVSKYDVEMWGESRELEESGVVTMVDRGTRFVKHKAFPQFTSNVQSYSTEVKHLFANFD